MREAAFGQKRSFARRQRGELSATATYLHGSISRVSAVPTSTPENLPLPLVQRAVANTNFRIGQSARSAILHSCAYKSVNSSLESVLFKGHCVAIKISRGNAEGSAIFNRMDLLITAGRMATTA